MNHELVQALERAGFPPKTSFDYVFDRVRDFPTLSELVEACGDGFFGLSHWPEGWTAEGGPVFQNQATELWTAQIQCKNLPTAEEAVANLWLALKNTRNTHVGDSKI